MKHCLPIAPKPAVLLASMLILSSSVTKSLMGAELQPLLETIRAAEPGARGNVQAARAWRQVAQADVKDLPVVLAALDGAGALAANWLRNAADTIAERELRSGGQLPVEALEQFVLDTGHDPRARRLAYELLARVDKTVSDRLIPGMGNDPSVEFRRDAVGRLLAQAEDLQRQKQKPAVIKTYRLALDTARDKDQVDAVAKQLRALGQEVDLPRHFGFLMNWRVIGPFDNTDRKGFASLYPPERELDVRAQYQGKGGPARWQDYSTEDDYGMVDLNEPFGKLKETVAFAWTRFASQREQEVQLRLGCKNAWKLWLNGELIFAREEYHRGMRLDQYVMPVKLKQGANDILLKLCQNEQQESWTVEWQFQLRVCDGTGTAIVARD